MRMVRMAKLCEGNVTTLSEVTEMSQHKNDSNSAVPSYNDEHTSDDSNVKAP